VHTQHCSTGSRAAGILQGQDTLTRMPGRAEPLLYYFAVLCASQQGATRQAQYVAALPHISLNTQPQVEVKHVEYCT